MTFLEGGGGRCSPRILKRIYGSVEDYSLIIAERFAKAERPPLALALVEAQLPQKVFNFLSKFRPIDNKLEPGQLLQLFWDDGSHPPALVMLSLMDQMSENIKSGNRNANEGGILSCSKNDN